MPGKPAPRQSAAMFPAAKRWLLPSGRGCVLVCYGMPDIGIVSRWKWLRSLGLLNCPILLADMGLSPEGREIALRLIRRWPDVVLWPVDDLNTYIFYH